MTKQIVFFGSSPFSVPVLERLVLSAGCQVLSVVTTPDKPVGRHLKITPNPVKVLAQKYNIPVFDNINDFLNKDWPNCIGLVTAYGRIIGPKTLSKFNGQVFGIHPSLLPKYRGPSPLQQQILDDVTESGVTIFKVDLGEDRGPIMAVERDIILPDDTTLTLGNRLFEKGVNLFLNNQESIINNQGNPQDNSKATHTHKFTRQDGFVKFEELGASPPASRNAKHLRAGSQELERKERAFFPWPGTWTIDPEGKRIKLS